MDCHSTDRRLRVQYPGALYHLMSRGVRRSSIFLNTVDRMDFFDRCERTVDRFGWEVFSVTQMTNHFHLLFRTPHPNLCRGAQYLLGTYALAFNRRHNRTGHVFEGRYRCRVIEDETYCWTVSRYDHLNPVPDLVAHPAEWPWSSYPGYCDASRRLPWVCYDGLLEAWSGDFGGSESSYCDFVEAGLARRDTVEYPPLIDRWIIGSEEFANRIRRQVSPHSNEPTVVRMRRLRLPVDVIVSAVCEEFEITTDDLATKSSRHPARPVLAHLARECSDATLQEIARLLGLSRRDSVPPVIKRLESVEGDLETGRRLAAIRATLDSENS